MITEMEKNMEKTKASTFNYLKGLMGEWHRGGSLFLVFLFSFFLLSSCGKDGGAMKVSHISYTDCKKYTDKETKADPIWGDPDSVSISYADGSIHVTHYNLLINCGFMSSGVVVDINVDGSTITISEHENPSGPLANCMCTTDNSFQIDNVPSGTYTLVFNNWYPEPYSQSISF